MAVAYQQLAKELRAQIASRTSSDRRMPTDAEICEMYGVSRQTARRAYQELISEGLVERVPGRGTFVTEMPRDAPYYRSFGSVEDLMALSLDTTMKVTRPLGTELNARVAEELGLGADSTVMSLEFARYHDSVPMCVSRIYLTPKIGELIEANGGIPDEGTTTVISIISELLPDSIGGVEQTITAVPCPLHIARTLDCEQGSPVLFVFRKYLDADGHPIEVAHTHYDPAVYSYRVRLGRG